MTPTLRALAAAALLASVSAQAAPTVYNSRSAFDAALASVQANQTTQGFQGLDPILFGTNLPDEDPSVRFGATVGSLSLNSPRALKVQADLNSGNVSINTAFSSAVPGQRFLRFSVPAAAIAFGIDLLDYQDPANGIDDKLTISGLGVTQELDTFPTPSAPTFFGVIDPAATTTSFTISRAVALNYPLTFDNVSFAAAPTAAPEPASLALLAVGALAAGLRRGRRSLS